VSYQSFVPPSHGILSMKCVPPATMSDPPLTPAKEPAKPRSSGSGGSGDHFKSAAVAATVRDMKRRSVRRMTGT
jgi:hypothetical protein